MRYAEIAQQPRMHGPGGHRSIKVPFVRQVLPDELARRLRDMIVEGELRPGGRITMQRLCKLFGVSRTPVREALKVLAIEGLVLLLPNRSAVVERVTRETIDDLLPILGAFEVVAGQLACARIDANGLAHIDALYERMLHHFRQRDEKSYQEAEHALRGAVFAAAGNASLVRLHEMVLMKLRWPVIGSGAPPEWERAVEERGRMVQALRLKDAELWALAAQRHLRHWEILLRQGVERMAGATAGRAKAGPAPR
jgi:DNA-binding GntR family transcriptional regulator